MSVHVVATLDTKGTEAAFVRERLQHLGMEICLIDAGSLGQPAIAGDISREAVFAEIGVALADVQRQGDRGQAVAYAAKGVEAVIRKRHSEGRVAGVLGLGGSAGTTIATAAMRALPLGVPKVMVSTLASGQTRPYVGGKDILMLNSVVDIAGINRISRTVLEEASAAMAGLVTFRPQPAANHDAADRPLVAATMFGVTTPCVRRAQDVLEQAGFEVVVFHATGTGGEAMEGLIDDGLFAGVLDVTTTELADELVGGILSAGPGRLTAAGRLGIPQVISVGAVDMVNFGPPETIPTRFQDRHFYQHNPTVTLMRTTAEENRRLGEEIGRKAAAAIGPAVIVVPRNGVSAIDRTGQPFDDPQARRDLIDGIHATCGSVEVVELDRHINDEEFAELLAHRLLEMLQSSL